MQSLLVLLAFAPALSQAACKAEGPLATARWVFDHAYFFYREPAADAQEYLSPAFLALLEKEWRCKAAGGTCAFSGDPWLEAEGEMQDPIVLSLVSSPPERRRVAVRYLFGPPDAAEPARSELSLVLDEASQCWKVDDLAGRRNSSLRRVLQQHRYD
jgi:hypothetical protein